MIFIFVSVFLNIFNYLLPILCTVNKISNDNISQNKTNSKLHDGCPIIETSPERIGTTLALVNSRNQGIFHAQQKSSRRVGLPSEIETGVAELKMFTGNSEFNYTSNRATSSSGE